MEDSTQEITSSVEILTDAPIIFTPKFLGEPPRSDKWKTVRKHHIIEEPYCRMCGGVTDLQVHHMIPFHLNEADELIDANLITLCECPGIDCHLKHGHLGDWHNFNPKIKVMANSSGQGIKSTGYVNQIDEGIIPATSVSTELS